jgi:signal recognition particle receptor subunit beta
VRTRGVELQRWLRKRTTQGGNSSTSLLVNSSDVVLNSEVVVGDEAHQKLPWYSVATFVDTPGQELFHRLRTNGALCGDVVILVVDAAEGVGKQVRYIEYMFSNGPKRARCLSIYI